MSSVILMFSLLTPNQFQTYATELLAPDEPRCEIIDEMLAKFDAEYEYELAVAKVSSLWG